MNLKLTTVGNQGYKLYFWFFLIFFVLALANNIYQWGSAGQDYVGLESCLVFVFFSLYGFFGFAIEAWAQRLDDFNVKLKQQAQMDGRVKIEFFRKIALRICQLSFYSYIAYVLYMLIVQDKMNLHLSLLILGVCVHLSLIRYYAVEEFFKRLIRFNRQQEQLKLKIEENQKDS